MGPIFRTALLGFNKEDVTGFLVKMNRKQEEEKAALSASLKAEVLAKEKELTERETKCDEIMRRSDVNLELLRRLPELRDRFRRLGEDLKNASDEEKKATAGLRDGVRRLTEENARLVVCREKAERFDQLAGALISIVGVPAGQKKEGELPECDGALSVDPEAGAEQSRKTQELLTETLSTFEEILGVLEQLEF